MANAKEKIEPHTTNDLLASIAGSLNKIVGELAEIRYILSKGK